MRDRETEVSREKENEIKNKKNVGINKLLDK